MQPARASPEPHRNLIGPTDAQTRRFWDEKAKAVRSNTLLQELFKGLEFPVRECHLLRDDDDFWRKTEKNIARIREYSKSNMPPCPHHPGYGLVFFTRQIKCAQNPFHPDAFAVATRQNQRDDPNCDDFTVFELPLMFDEEECSTHFFAMLDGHGKMGSLVSSFCKERLQGIIKETMAVFNTKGDRYSFANALILSFVKLDSLLKKEKFSTISGTTLCLAAIVKGHLIIANCGDSRAVLGRGVNQNAVELSLDYSTENELPKMTSLKRGGVLHYEREAWRVDGKPMITRAIGDEGLMSTIAVKPISCRPKITIIKLDPREHDPKTACLILATDGAFDVISSDECVQYACSQFYENTTPEKVAKSLVQIASNRGSVDDITALVLPLKQYLKQKNLRKSI